LQLRNNATTSIDEDFSYCNFGKSKGKTVDRVLIYPTKGICEWLADSQKPLNEETRAKLYVAITRARYSVAFVVPDKYARQIQNIAVWRANN
jgi:ATP-dependent exoDNAse (exonuclease V) alpha subunit